MIILKNGEKPENKDYAYYLSLNSRDPQTDVMWFTAEEWLSKKGYSAMKDKKMSGKIEALIEKWAEEARKHRKDKVYWPVKLASVEYYTEEGKFVIAPKDLGEDIDDFEFEMAEGTITKDLYDLGVLKTFYTGMPD